MTTKPTFPSRLAALIERSGLSMSALAQQSEVDRAYLYALLKGTKQPSWRVACQLADGLGVSVADLR